MTELDEADVLRILARVKSFHAPQDGGDTVVSSWLIALQRADVRNVNDADMAVVEHYSAQGSNPWITPADVIQRYRQIRSERLIGVKDADLTEDVDPYDGAAYLATLRHRTAAVADGCTVSEARALPLPPAAAHALVDRKKQPVLLARGE